MAGWFGSQGHETGIFVNNVYTGPSNLCKFSPHVYIHGPAPKVLNIPILSYEMEILSGLWSCKESRFLGRVGFLTTVGSGQKNLTLTPDVQLDNFLHYTPKLGIPVEMVRFLYHT